MRGARSWFVVASLAALAAACADAPQAPQSTSSSAPSLAAGELAAAPCAAATARTVYGEINALLSSKDQTQARSLFRQVEAACDPASLGAAGAKAVAYYRFFLSVYFAIPSRVRGAAPAAASAQHFENVAVYVGLSTRFVEQHFTADGAIRVCPSADAPNGPCVVKTGDNAAGISVPNAALPGPNDAPRLFTVAPADPTECARDNLEFVPNCFQFDVTPALRGGERFDVDVALSVCVDDDEGRSSRLRLAHPEPGAADPKRVEVTPATDLLAAFGAEAPACGLHASRGPDVRGAGLLAAWQRLGAVAARGWAYLGPRTAFAVHAGVGGSVRELSPFGAVDPLVFSGTFDSERFQVGPFPAAIAAERGGWTSSYASPPASITVAESLGDLGTAPGDRVVVLNQGGGACAACPRLTLTGTLRGESGATPRTGTIADVGVYRVVWSSVQAKETAKLAPIDLQDRAGRIIARVAYRTVGSANQLVAYGRALTGPNADAAVEVVLGSFTVNARNTFALRVDLDAGTFQVLSINPPANPLAPPPPPLATLRFLQDATALEQYAIKFEGIDAGILGIDGVGVTRLPDRTPNQP
ncbi:MAG: hypothetical protein AVDCRST_MAG11-523 [uncultured Gemmatimonadaceae bacterium]|uniref:Lipoprotein n=1 Tax=uncultured Gemmatimonadaceae bacterium TaxID=246130 RepID=A0A6J4K619_9BACT|nr:MAG: hypothetical protein AVDCRST_MAG11-523 [uncultured Gemmatimonadaceae bacterium]